MKLLTTAAKTLVQVARGLAVVTGSFAPVVSGGRVDVPPAPATVTDWP